MANQSAYRCVVMDMRRVWVAIAIAVAVSACSSGHKNATPPATTTTTTFDAVGPSGPPSHSPVGPSVVVPNVVGKRFQRASRLLATVHLTTVAPTGTVGTWVVVTQSPRASSQVRWGSRVTLEACPSAANGTQGCRLGTKPFAVVQSR